MHCSHCTQFHVKLPPHLTDTAHMLSPIWLQLDFSICKTPGKHVRWRWKARCLQTGKEIRYLSCQLKWTQQMYFWLKLKSWALSCYPWQCCQMHSVCLTKRHPLVIWARLWFPTIHDRGAHYKGLLKGRGIKYWIHRSRLMKSGTEINLFYLSWPTNILTVRGAFWKENKWNQSPSILVCKNGSQFRLADNVLPRTQAWEWFWVSYYVSWTRLPTELP